MSNEQKQHTVADSDESVQEPVAVSRDLVRLLYAVSLYTKGKPHRWLKEFNVSVIAYEGVRKGVFEGYHLTPSMFEFRGVKMFAIVSQDALGDLDLAFDVGLIHRILLNTRFYDQITAVRISERGEGVLQDKEGLTDADRQSVHDLVSCPKCGQLVDFAVSGQDDQTCRLIMNRVCACETGGAHRDRDVWDTSSIEAGQDIGGFFSIGTARYACRAFFMEQHGERETTPVP